MAFHGEISKILFIIKDVDFLMPDQLGNTLEIMATFRSVVDLIDEFKIVKDDSEKNKIIDDMLDKLDFINKKQDFFRKLRKKELDISNLDK